MTTPTPTANPGVPVYVYRFYNPGNNEIKTEDPSLPIFTTITTRGVLDILKQTTVVCQGGGEKPGKVQGEIDWKNKKITVEGVTKTIKEAKHKIGGTFSRDIEWTWSSGKYTTTHESGVWTAKRGSQALAVYTSLVTHTFSKNELATLKFLVDMPTEEKVFLLLALMFHDLQLPPVPEPKSFGQAAGEAGVAVATTVAANVAVNAVTSCCVVQ